MLASRPSIFAVSVWVAVFVAMCSPFHRSSVAGIPENLWTRAPAYSWHSRISSYEVLPFRRTEHGLLWHFRVVDRGQGNPHWSARLEPRALLAYAFIASLVSGAFYLVRSGQLRRTTHRILGKDDDRNALEL